MNDLQGVQSLIGEDSCGIGDLSLGEGFYKIKSFVLLRNLGFPVLDGFLVSDWSSEVREHVEWMLDELGWEQILVRHDAKVEEGRYPRGGFVADRSRFLNEVEDFISVGRVVLALEGVPPYYNGYNFNILFTSPNRAFVEVMAPGFDASDLKRGEFTPHELIEIEDELGLNNSPSLPAALTRLRLAAKEEYRSSVRRRLTKIADEGLRAEAKASESLEDLRKNVERLLGMKGKSTKLPLKSTYIPIRRSQLAEFWSPFYGNVEDLASFCNQGFPFAVSASFVNWNEKLVFWDVIWPQLKFSVVEAAQSS